LILNVPSRQNVAEEDLLNIGGVNALSTLDSGYSSVSNVFNIFR
jgi:hypothetical protein